MWVEEGLPGRHAARPFTLCLESGKVSRLFRAILRCFQVPSPPRILSLLFHGRLGVRFGARGAICFNNIPLVWNREPLEHASALGIGVFIPWTGARREVFPKLQLFSGERLRDRGVQHFGSSFYGNCGGVIAVAVELLP